MFLRSLKATGPLPVRSGKVITQVTGSFFDAGASLLVTDGFVSILQDGSVALTKILLGIDEPSEVNYKAVITTLYTDGSHDSVECTVSSADQIIPVKDYDQQFIATNAAILTNSRFLEEVVHLIDGRKI